MGLWGRVSLVASLCALGGQACGSSDKDDAGAGDRDAAQEPADGSTEEEGGMEPDAGPCVPSPSTFDSQVLPVIERRCATCHGDPLQQGAPFSLLEYAPLVEEGPAGSIAERMLIAVSTDFMPPPSAPQPSPEEREILLRWASCGEQPASTE